MRPALARAEDRAHVARREAELAHLPEERVEDHNRVGRGAEGDRVGEDRDAGGGRGRVRRGLAERAGARDDRDHAAGRDFQDEHRGRVAHVEIVGRVDGQRARRAQQPARGGVQRQRRDVARGVHDAHDPVARVADVGVAERVERGRGRRVEANGRRVRELAVARVPRARWRG